MPYLSFISTEYDSKSGKIKGLDVTFQMNIIAKIYDIIKYFKNKIRSKIIKKMKIGKMAQMGPKWKMDPNFFSGE